MQAGGELEPALPDAALIDASRAGNATAFAQIIERYQRAVHAVSFSQLRDRALADDITQDAFVMAWHRLGELRDAERLPAWLCGIARNLARDARKRQRREDADADVLDVPAATTPFDVLSDAESDRLIAIALAGIPDAYREPLVLFYYEQRSVEEVARVLGISAATTHKRLSRGRQYLADRVSTLVERDLARRGPKRELVASVLAVIAIASTASHVDASPAPKGSTMPVKLTIVAAATLLAGAGGVLSADVARSRSTTHAKAAPGAKPATNAKPSPTPTRPPRSPASAQPARTRTAGPALASSPPTVVPDCKAVGAHVAAISLPKPTDLAEPAKPVEPLPAKKRAFIMTTIADKVERSCLAEQWSENVRLCYVDADDYQRAQIDCTDEPVATAAEVAALPPELRCDALVDHVFALANAPDGKFGILRRKLAGNPDKAPMFERLVAKARDAMAAECNERPWSIEHRRCMAASTTHQATASCR